MNPLFCLNEQNLYENHYMDEDNNYIELFIKKVDKINSIKQDFWCNFIIKLYHLEEEPNIEILNLVKKSNVIVKKHEEIINLKKVNITEYNYFLKLKSHFDFHSFPKDKQKLFLKLKNNDYKPLKQLGYKLNNNDLILWNNEFSLNSNLKCFSNDNEISYSFEIKRNSRNYFWNIILLNFLIALTSFASFSIEKNNSADRLNLNGMLLLTKVAFKQVNNENVPNISYLTLLDKYVFTGLGFMFLVILQNSLAPNFNSDFELYSILSLSGIFVIYNFMYLLFWNLI